MKVVIIGGVAGGATAAARLRRLDENAEIIILERSGYVSYANCGLPYYIGGEITDREALTLQTPESFFRRFRIDVRTRQEALRIDRKEKRVLVHNLADGSEYTESYDKLILSPGARPLIPDISGTDAPGVFHLRTVEDTFRIYDYIAQKQPKSAAVIGGGFIGLEMAENLKSRGLDVTLLQRSGQVMPPLDADMASIVHNYIRAKGIDLLLRASVTGISASEGSLDVRLAESDPVSAELVILAVGVVPENHLAKEAGLALGMKGAVRTNSHMQTDDPDIYAVGDAVEVIHFVSGEHAVISLAGPANKQGRVAADHICGVPRHFKGSQGSSVLKLFDMTIASTGLNEKSIRAAGMDFDSVIIGSASHAAYYPEAASMTLKVLFEKGTGKILGAQIIGFGGVDKRIDVLAVAIRSGMTAWDLTELDLAYAPPYSSAKDPVNMAGYVIENLLEGRVKQIHWQALETLPGNAVVLDVRTPEEYAMGHLDCTLHIPVDELRERMGEIPAGRPVYVHCQSGLRSYLACRILSQKGFDCYNIAGGYAFYDNLVRGASPDPEGTGPCGMKIK